MYTCAMCGGEFNEGQTEEEAVAEYESHFGNMSGVPVSVVCDDCYQKINPANNPHAVERAVEEINALHDDRAWPEAGDS